MKKITLLFLIITMFGGAFAQTKTPPKKGVKPEELDNERLDGTVDPHPSKAMKKSDFLLAMTKYRTPGPLHEMIAKFNGDWKEDLTFWMVPGAPPTKSTATCSNTMIMGNLFQMSKHTAMMDNMPFEGSGLLGYDNAKDVFVSTWIDNMGTGIMHLEGKWDALGKTIHFIGTSVDPMTGEDVKVREEFRLIDNNNQRLEMFMTKNGAEYKSMEIKFTR